MNAQKIALTDHENIVSQSIHDQVKYTHCKKIAVGIGVLDTPLRHKPQPFSRYCGFSNSASSFGGTEGSRKTRWFAQAVASTPNLCVTTPLAWGGDF